MPKAPAKMSSLDIPSPVTTGPAFSALSPRHQAFVIAYCCNGCNATAAAKEAGYKGEGLLHTQGYRVKNREDVRLAIREVTLASIQANLPKYTAALEKIAADENHRQQYKALVALLTRGGIAEMRESNVNVTIRTEAEKVERIRELAEKHNIPIAEVLGTVTDAQYEVLPPGGEADGNNPHNGAAPETAEEDEE